MKSARTSCHVTTWDKMEESMEIAGAYREARECVCLHRDASTSDLEIVLGTEHAWFPHFRGCRIHL